MIALQQDADVEMKLLHDQLELLVLRYLNLYELLPVTFLCLKPNVSFVLFCFIVINILNVAI